MPTPGSERPVQGCALAPRLIPGPALGREGQQRNVSTDVGGKKPGVGRLAGRLAQGGSWDQADPSRLTLSTSPGPLRCAILLVQIGGTPLGGLPHDTG